MKFTIYSISWHVFICNEDQDTRMFYLVLLHSPIVRKTSECSKRHPFNGYSKLINGKIFCKNISLVARINM